MKIVYIMIMLKVLILILILPLILLAGLLSFPVEYCINGYKFENYHLGFRITWLFKGLQFIFYKEDNSKAYCCIKILGHTLDMEKKPHKKVKKKKAKEKTRKRGKKLNWAFSRGLFKCTIKFIRDILGHMKPRKFYIEGCYGFDDPCTTGIVSSLVGYSSSIGQNYNIKLSPVFDEEIIEGRFIIQARAVPIVILYMAARFILSRPVLNIIKERKSR